LTLETYIFIISCYNKNCTINKEYQLELCGKVTTPTQTDIVKLGLLLGLFNMNFGKYHQFIRALYYRSRESAKITEIV